MTLETMALLASVMLAIYTLGTLYALIIPAKHRDPHDGMARGCLMFVILGLVGIGGMLAIGVASEIAWMVRIPFYITIYPAFAILGGGVVHLIQRYKQRRRRQRSEVSGQ